MPLPPSDAEDIPGALLQGLPLSQSQGLPFQGSSGGLAFQPRPPLAAVQLQGNPLGNEPQPGMVGKIGNILQSINAGYQNELAPWEKIQLAAQQRALEQQGLAQRQQMQEAQIPNIQAHTQMLQGQMADLGFKTMQHAAQYLSFIPKEEQQNFLDGIRPMIQQQLRMGAAQDPAAQKLAGNDKFVDYIIKAGVEKGQAFADQWRFLPQNVKGAVAQMAINEPEKAEKLAEATSTQVKHNILSDVGARVRATGIEGGQSRTFDRAMSDAKATPEERMAIQELIAKEKPEQVAQAFAALNVIPPSAMAEQVKAGAIETGKQQTVGGQATIAKTIAETQKAGYMAVPGQGGTLVQLGPTGGGAPLAPLGQPSDATTLQSNADRFTEKAAATSNPEEKKVLLAAADAARTAAKATGAAQPAGGPRVVLQTPGAALSLPDTKALNSYDKLLTTFNNLMTLKNTGVVDDYIGPKIGRPKQYLRELSQKTGVGSKEELPKEAAYLQVLEGDLRNFIIPEVTGAAVGANERPDIMRSFPNSDYDRPKTFWIKADYARAVADTVAKRARAYLGPDGRLLPGKTEAQMQAEFPFPSLPITSNKPDATPAGPGRPYSPPKAR